MKNGNKNIKRYRIQKIERVANLDAFSDIDSWYEQTTIRINGSVIAQIRLKGKKCYYHSMTMFQNDYVLKQVMLFVKMWNGNFDDRKKNKGVKFVKRTDAELEQKPKTVKPKKLVVEKRAKKTSYDKLSKVKDCADYRVLRDNHNKPLVFARIKGKTCYYYIVRNENSLCALGLIGDYIREWNNNILESKSARITELQRAA